MCVCSLTSQVLVVEQMSEKMGFTLLYYLCARRILSPQLIRRRGWVGIYLRIYNYLLSHTTVMQR